MLMDKITFSRKLKIVSNFAFGLNTYMLSPVQAITFNCISFFLSNFYRISKNKLEIVICTTSGQSVTFFNKRKIMLLQIILQFLSI